MKYILCILLLISVIVLGCKQDNPIQSNSFKAANNACDSQKDDVAKDKCLIKSAVTNTDESFCLKITDSYAKDMCYVQLAAWNSDANYCSKASLDQNVELCYFGTAVQANNLALCDKLRNLKELPYTKEICIKAASIHNTKPNIRDDSFLADDKILIPEFVTSPEQDNAVQ